MWSNLLVVQRALLAQDLVADPDLADVVQQPGEVDVAQLVLRQAQLAPELDGDPGDPLAVAEGVRVLGVDRRGERPGQADQEVPEMVVALRARA